GDHERRHGQIDFHRADLALDAIADQRRSGGCAALEPDIAEVELHGAFALFRDVPAHHVPRSGREPLVFAMSVTSSRTSLSPCFTTKGTSTRVAKFVDFLCLTTKLSLTSALVGLNASKPSVEKGFQLVTRAARSPKLLMRYTF